LNTHVRLTKSAAEAASALIHGHLVALPTETVYGLGADAENPAAVARIFQVKGRPSDHPVIVHVADLSAVDAWAGHIPDFARALAEAFWPGPMTLVLPRSARAADQLTGGQPSIGLRVPSHPDFRAILARFCERTHPSAGIAAPSANRFGRVSPTTATHVLDELADFAGPDDLVFDGGPSAIGLESTIIDCTGTHPVILRAGAVTAEQVEDVTQLLVGSTSTVRASGTLDVHYAPNAQVVSITADEATDIPAGSGFIALASLPTPPHTIRLLAAESDDAYAHGLYGALREADERGVATVYVVPPAKSGIGLAINDRINRAAAARSHGPHDA
jgi:L-threonylcarbamoyladenylate synthase